MIDKKVAILNKLFSGTQTFLFSGLSEYPFIRYRQKTITLQFNFSHIGGTLFIDALCTTVMVPEEITSFVDALQDKLKHFNINTYVLSGISQKPIKVWEGWRWVYNTQNACEKWVILSYQTNCKWIKD